MFSLIPLSRATPASGRQLSRLRDEFESLFENFFRVWPHTGAITRDAGWGLDLTESETDYLVKAELPGFDVSELDVQLSSNVLTLTAEKKAKDNGNQRRVERVVTLPDGFDPAKVEAKYVNGVLEVHVGKSEAVKPRKIDVKV